MISIVIISKDEPALDDTLVALSRQADDEVPPVEVVVVDASQGRLAPIRDAHPAVRWIDYVKPPGATVTIPHQRNAGVAASSGDVIAFVDAGCIPRPGWLRHLTAPIVDGPEDVVTGIALTPEGSIGLYDTRILAGSSEYVSEFPTINVAFRRTVFDKVEGFDESFEYGSDIDFSWRVVDAGFRVLRVADAVVEHDWGSLRRQLKRSFVYGKARARLYGKHRHRLRQAVRHDPMILVYPAFLLGLPLTLAFPLYPLLLVIPAWRNRHEHPMRTIADHLVFGAGVLREVVRR